MKCPAPSMLVPPRSDLRRPPGDYALTSCGNGTRSSEKPSTALAYPSWDEAAHCACQTKTNGYAGWNGFGQQRREQKTEHGVLYTSADEDGRGLSTQTPGRVAEAEVWGQQK